MEVLYITESLKYVKLQIKFFEIFQDLIRGFIYQK